jgi:hypothetical protein
MKKRLEEFKATWLSAGQKHETGLTEREANIIKWKFESAKLRFMKGPISEYTDEVSMEIKNIEARFLSYINAGLRNHRKEKNKILTEILKTIRSIYLGEKKINPPQSTRKRK